MMENSLLPRWRISLFVLLAIPVILSTANDNTRGDNRIARLGIKNLRRFMKQYDGDLAAATPENIQAAFYTFLDKRNTKNGAVIKDWFNKILETNSDGIQKFIDHGIQDAEAKSQKQAKKFNRKHFKKFLKKHEEDLSDATPESIQSDFHDFTERKITDTEQQQQVKDWFAAQITARADALQNAIDRIDQMKDQLQYRKTLKQFLHQYLKTGDMTDATPNSLESDFQEYVENQISDAVQQQQFKDWYTSQLEEGASKIQNLINRINGFTEKRNNKFNHKHFNNFLRKHDEDLSDATPENIQSDFHNYLEKKVQDTEQQQQVKDWFAAQITAQADALQKAIDRIDQMKGAVENRKVVKTFLEQSNQNLTQASAQSLQQDFNQFVEEHLVDDLQRQAEVKEWYATEMMNNGVQRLINRIAEKRDALQNRELFRQFLQQHEGELTGATPESIQAAYEVYIDTQISLIHQQQQYKAWYTEQLEDRATQLQRAINKIDQLKERQEEREDKQNRKLFQKFLYKYDGNLSEETPDSLKTKFYEYLENKQKIQQVKDWYNKQLANQPHVIQNLIDKLAKKQSF